MSDNDAFRIMSRETAGRWLCALSIFAACIFSSPHAKAGEAYLTAGIGEARLLRPHENQWWVQDGWDHTIQEKTTTYRLGAGWSFNENLAMEVSYQSLGQYNHFAGFMLDESKYSPDTATHCKGQCDPTQWGYLSGSAEAISFTLIPELPLGNDWSVFGVIGAAYYVAKFHILVTPQDEFARQLIRNDSLSQSGWSRVQGLGVSYKSISLEVTQYPGVKSNNGACCSAYQSATTFMLSYDWVLK